MVDNRANVIGRNNLYDLLIECCRIDPDLLKIESYAARIEDWNAFHESAYAHGVYPLVQNVLKTVPGVPENIQVLLKKTYRDIALRNMTMTAELFVIVEKLKQHDIEAIAFKGPVLSQMLYGAVTQRQYADLDILIDENVLSESVKLLSECGYHYEHSADFFKNRFLLRNVKDIVVSNPKKSVHLEIHWKLFMGRLFQNVNHTQLLDRPEEVEIQGRAIATLHADVLAVYLLSHGSKHLWERIEWIADIDRLCRIKPDISWERVEAMAHRMEIAPFVFLGMEVCSQIFGTPFPSDIMQRVRNDQKIVRAAETLCHRIYANRIHDIDEYMENFYYLGIDNSIPWISRALSRFYRPSIQDIYTINLPDRLWLLYYVILTWRVIKTQIALRLGWSRKKSGHKEEG